MREKFELVVMIHMIVIKYRKPFFTAKGIDNVTVHFDACK